MPKTRILLASVLKPVTDIRMFGKLGRSLEKLPDAEICLVGQPAEIPENETNFRFHPLPAFRRLSIKRLLAQWKYYKILHKVKPQVIIVTTPELLPVSLLHAILFKAELYYDVQENYFNNITLQPTYPAWLKPLIAYPLRFLETLAARRISHFFLAEKSYAAELPFLGEKYTVLENKYQPKAGALTQNAFPVKVNLAKKTELLYSGTIAEVYGIWEAVRLTEKLHAINPLICLTIIGFCAQEDTLFHLQEMIRNKPYITLIGGSTLVPHENIRKAIQNAQIGLLPYRGNPSTAHCMPTKLFEYLANGLPMLLPENPLWEGPVRKSQAGFTIDFRNPDPELILNRLASATFYPGGIPQDVFWEEEEKKLLDHFHKKALKP